MRFCIRPLNGTFVFLAIMDTSDKRLPEVVRTSRISFKSLSHFSLKARRPAERAKQCSLPAYASDFLATRDGLALMKAFMRLTDAKLRRRIVSLVEEIAGGEAP